MTKKDYIRAVAEINSKPLHNNVKKQIVEIFTSFFAADNVRFDEVRFKQACNSLKE
jgi:hypothetical protein